MKNFRIIFSFPRWLGVLALAATVFGCISNADDERGTKVLVIGDDFTRTCLVHLPAIATEKKTDLDLTSLTMDGCTFHRHVNCYSDEFPDRGGYLMLRSRFGKRSSRRIGLVRALELAKWDIVVLQQAGTNAAEAASYEPDGSDLVAKIRAKLPTARLFIQEVWSPTPWEARLKKGDDTPESLFDKIHRATADFARRNGLTVIPFGSAVQTWRRRLPVEYTDRSFGGDVVGGRNQSDEDDFKRRFDGVWEPNGDLEHLNEKGEFLQALVWGSVLLDLDFKKLKYRPACVTKEEAKLMVKIARPFTKGKEGDSPASE